MLTIVPVVFVLESATGMEAAWPGLCNLLCNNVGEFLAVVDQRVHLCNCVYFHFRSLKIKNICLSVYA